MKSLPRALAALFAALLLLSPAVARADDATTVTVEGTSDVSDSHLMDQVIEPGFEAAYPQYNLQYSAPSGGTGAALDTVRNGTGSGLLVHAQSLENQFVADGLSVEPYGRAVFYGDYVILGPSSDPAGVLSGAPHDAAAAFKQIADYAVAHPNQLGFVSRGNTSGTAVQEHLIWALADQTFDGIPGVTFCTWHGANRGGGEAPGAATGECPSPNVNPPSGWYITSGQSQGPNITTADACAAIASHLCYTFTDRGTFQYMVSKGLIANLKIVGRDNAAEAPGGSTLLINTFHLYAVNPNGHFNAGAHPAINTAGALAFLNYVTSPAAQAAIGRYLNTTGSDEPFIPDAAPALTGTSVPATVAAGTPVTVTGSLRNLVPGTPPLSGQTVTLATPGGPAATGTTDANGNYSLSYTPAANASYTVGTAQIAKIENTTLNPVFGDLLVPQTTAVGSTTVQSSIKVDKVATGYRSATVAGSVLPGSSHNAATVSVLARKKGSSGAFVSYAKAAVPGGAFSVPVKLAPGAWEIQARFDDPGQVLSSVAPTTTATVPGASTVKFSHVTLKSHNKLTVTGKLTPAPSSTGGYVRLLGRKSGKGSYRSIGRKVDIAKGRESFTIRTSLTRHAHYQLQVEYVHKGQIDTSKSSTRKVTVH